MNYMHKDLSPENILINDKYEIKLINLHKSNYMLTPAPEDFSAPELSLGYKSDIWSFAYILYFLHTGKRPEPNRTVKICKEAFSELDFPHANPLKSGPETTQIDKELRNFLARCLRPYNERPRTAEIRFSSFFKGYIIHCEETEKQIRRKAKMQEAADV